MELQILATNNNPEIIVITECNSKTAMSVNPNEIYKLKDCNSFYNGNKGRGIIIFTKISLKVVQDPKVYLFQEYIWLQIELGQGKRLLLGGIYRSPSSKIENFEQMECMFREIITNKLSQVVILGDFNLKNIDWNLNSTKSNTKQIEHRFIECIKDLYLTQHIKEPTRYRKDNTPSILDLIFSNEENMIENIYYHAGLGKSDHLVLSFDIICSADLKTSQVIKLNYKKANWKEITNDLYHFYKGKTYNGDIETCWENFENTISNLKEMHIPKFKKYTRGQDVPIDSETLMAIKNKRTKWRKYIYCKNHFTYENYKKARNKVAQLIKNRKYNQEK